MNKLIALIFLLMCGIGFSQSPQNNLSGDIPTDYIRPGLLILHNKQGGEFDFNNFKFPSQFDEIKIRNQEFSYSMEFDGLTSTDIFNKINSGEKVSKEEREKAKENDSLYNYIFSKKEYSDIISKFTGEYMASVMEIENGQPNWEKLLERSRNSLTESQRNQLKNLSGGSLGDNAQNLLLDPILDRNYIMVITPYDRTESEDGLGSSVQVSIFRVELAEGNDIQSKKNAFFSKFGNNYDLVKDSEFPVTFLGSGVGYASTIEKQSIFYTLGLSKKRSKEIRTPEEREFDLNTRIIEQGIDIGIRYTDNWKPRAIVQKGMKIALGTKEGLRKDDLYISYERVIKKNGEISNEIRGYDRVKRVGNNDIDLTESDEIGELSKLYPDGGKRTKTAYISMRQPEVGLGTSVFYRNSVGFRLDQRLRFVLNSMIYIEGEFLGSNELIGGSDILFSAGIQKYINIGRKISLVPFAQYGTIFNTQEAEDAKNDSLEDGNANIAGFVGSRLAIKLSPKIQLIPEVSILVGELDTSDLLPSLKTKESYSDRFEDGPYFGFTLRWNN